MSPLLCSTVAVLAGVTVASSSSPAPSAAAAGFSAGGAPHTAAAGLAPLPAPPRGYSTWQWFPGTHWGKAEGQYNAVDEATCRLQAQAMVDKGLVKAVRAQTSWLWKCSADSVPACRRAGVLYQQRCTSPTYALRARALPFAGLHCLHRGRAVLRGARRRRRAPGKTTAFPHFLC